MIPLRHPDKINWRYLSINPNINLILKDIRNQMDINKSDINWFLLSLNPGGIEIIEKHKNKINSIILKNPEIFILDYNKMKENFLDMEEEILKSVLHPKRVLYNLITYNYDIDDMFI